MDTIAALGKRAVMTYMDGFYQLYDFFASFNLGEVIEYAQSGNFWRELNWSTFLMMATVTVLGFLWAYANLFMPESDTKPTWTSKDSDVKHKEDAPPIPPPTEIVALRVYPIKSCRGIEIDSSPLYKSGLLLDRNWMFVDKAKMEFLTIRSNSQMTLIDTNIVEDQGQQMLQVGIHGQPDKTVKIPAFPSADWLKSNTTLSKVNIWGADTDGYEYGPEVNDMFRDFFGKDVALIYKGPTPRMVAVNGAKEMYGKETPHHFADVMSLQVASEASLKDLNRRLKLSEDKQLTIERFRPNIIIRGRDDKPWEEDTWKRIRLTTRLVEQELLYRVDLDVVARCARCQVPNVNPSTAEKNAKQPWDELMKFRRVDQGGVAKFKPCFGMLCVPKNEGRVQIGAMLEVLETTDKHLYNTAKFEDL